MAKMSKYGKNVNMSPAGELGGDVCDGCGREYWVVFNVPSDVWAKIAPCPDTLDRFNYRGGMLCPDCAATRAKGLGVHLVFTAEVWRSE